MLIVDLIPAFSRELLPHSPRRSPPATAASVPHISTERHASDRPWRPAKRALHLRPQPSSEPTSCHQRPHKDLRHTHSRTVLLTNTSAVVLLNSLDSTPLPWKMYRGIVGNVVIEIFRTKEYVTENITEHIKTYKSMRRLKNM